MCRHPVNLACKLFCMMRIWFKSNRTHIFLSFLYTTKETLEYFVDSSTRVKFLLIQFPDFYKSNFSLFDTIIWMTGLLYSMFDVGGILKPAIFWSLPWAYEIKMAGLRMPPTWNEDALLWQPCHMIIIMYNVYLPWIPTFDPTSK